MTWQWDRNMSNLRNLLAGLYYRDADIERVVSDVELNPAFIGWHSRPVNTWQSVLEEAINHGKVQDIIALARKEKPNVQGLALAEQHLLLAVEAPVIGDEAWQGPTEPAKLEALMGAVSTLRHVSFLEQGTVVARSVARIELPDGSTGSGFLIQDGLLVTNHHVLPSPEVAGQAVVQFNYQMKLEGNPAKADPYGLAPAPQGFATSPKEEQGGDDWTIVRVQDDPAVRWGALTLSRASPRAEDEVIIIQHPMGGPKQIAMTHNIVAYADDRRLQYLTDTLEGSSGSPVLSMDWQVVGLHYTGGWLREPGTKQAVYRNAGIHVNVLIDGLARARQDGRL